MQTPAREAGFGKRSECRSTWICWALHGPDNNTLEPAIGSEIGKLGAMNGEDDNHIWSTADRRYVDTHPQQMGLRFEDAVMKPAETRCRLETESDVVAAAVALGALRFPDLSSAEMALIRRASDLPASTAEHLKRDIVRKRDSSVPSASSSSLQPLPPAQT
jgi:hypothetical protein